VLVEGLVEQGVLKGVRMGVQKEGGNLPRVVMKVEVVMELSCGSSVLKGPSRQHHRYSEAW
jgi:hypothetical protein